MLQRTTGQRLPHLPEEDVSSSRAARPARGAVRTKGVGGIGAPFSTNHLRGRRSPEFACFSAFDFSILF